MAARNIVIGQAADSVKLQRARELRKEMTPEEKMLWRHLRGNWLQGLHFRRQQAIDGFIVDFYCHAAGLVVEVDGPIHEAQADYDAERDRVLSERGLRMLRLKNEEVSGNISAVLNRIAAACSERI